MPDLLPIIDREISDRVENLIAERPEWPCRKGCDHCCRSLAEPLRITLAEWRRLESALERLPEPIRRKVESRLQAAAQQNERPHVCPFLERASGACLVYEKRPAACRAYGFFRARTGGRFCDLVQTMIESEGEEGLVWGNHDSLEQRLERAYGDTVTLAAWLELRDSQP